MTGGLRANYIRCGDKQDARKHGPRLARLLHSVVGDPCEAQYCQRLQPPGLPSPAKAIDEVQSLCIQRNREAKLCKSFSDCLHFQPPYVGALHQQAGTQTGCAHTIEVRQS